MADSQYKLMYSWARRGGSVHQVECGAVAVRLTAIVQYNEKLHITSVQPLLMRIASVVCRFGRFGRVHFSAGLVLSRFPRSGLMISYDFIYFQTIFRFPMTEDEDFTIESAVDDEPGETGAEHLSLRDKQYETELTAAIEDAIRTRWGKMMGAETEIVIAQLRKFGEGGGLGISLEGTVDVEDGQEVRPHHYIRSILAEGPVGKNGKLRSGDELLEVNGHRLLGMNHLEVVSILKELPMHVRMICGRGAASACATGYRAQAQGSPFAQARGLLGGSLQSLLPSGDRLVKAKSDGSLATSAATAAADAGGAFSKMKSRSLEPLTGLAMWSSEPQIIELVKGERGLGFSILDYQDPIDPNDTVIVIRSLVPGGVAQLDGRLIPGDRLLFVNDTVLENASLDQAVQALKGAAKGIVKIGVAKPLPIPDTVSLNAQPPPPAAE